MNSVLDSSVNSDVMIEENEVSDFLWSIVKFIFYVILAFIILIVFVLIYWKVCLMINYVDLSFGQDGFFSGFVCLDGNKIVWIKMHKSYINPTMIPNSHFAISYQLMCDNERVELHVNANVYQSKIISLIKENSKSISANNEIQYDLSGIDELKKICTDIVNNDKDKNIVLVYASDG